MKMALYFFKNSMILADFLNNVGYFSNNLTPYCLPTKNSVCSVINVPKKANNITNFMDSRPCLHKNPAVRTATSPSMHANKKIA